MFNTYPDKKSVFAFFAGVTFAELFLNYVGALLIWYNVDHSQLEYMWFIVNTFGLFIVFGNLLGVFIFRIMVGRFN